jgi:predicted dehydrogenase
MSDQIDRPIDRRWFLGSSAAALGYFMTADKLTAVRAADEPSSKIRIAGIGVGGKGGSDIDQAGNVGQIVALCDIDEGNLNAKAKKWPEAAKYFDYRKLLEEQAKSIDAVVVSTPDHNHALPSLMAMRMKKHVYCQKPLTHTVFEARLMRETAKKYGVCTQMGNQGSAESGLRRAVELVQDGLLGEIKEIHVWTNRPIWPQAPGVVKRPDGEKPVPASVHWAEFIGPAPMRPYNAGYHPFAWRGWLDFGTGALGDMACHTANMAFRACELGSPTTIEADATDVNPETYSSSAKITYAFPKRGDKPHQSALTFFWYEGKRDGKKVLPPQELLGKLLKEKEKLADSGSIIVGSKAILFSPNDYGAQFRILGAEAANTGKPERLPVNGKGDQGMKSEWAQAIRDGKPEVAYSNFDIAGMLTEAMLLGNVAIRSGKKLEFDAGALKITNDAAANLFLSKEYRKGWEVAEKA